MKSARDFTRRLIDASVAANSGVLTGELSEFATEIDGFDHGTSASVAAELFRDTAAFVSSLKGSSWDRYQAVERMSADDPHTGAVASAARRILERPIEFTDTELVSVIEAAITISDLNRHAMPHFPALLNRVLERGSGGSMSESLRSAVIRLQDAIIKKSWYLGGDPARELEAVLQPSLLPIDPGEAWSDRVYADLEDVPAELRTAWIAILDHATAASGSKPSARWLKNGDELVGKVTRESFRESVLSWLPLVDRPRTSPAPRYCRWDSDVGEHQLTARNADVVKGLVWLVAQEDRPDIARALADLAQSAYRKIPGVGPREVKVGNAAVTGLGLMPGRAALGGLAMLAVKIKFRTAQKLVVRSLDMAAEREGIPRDEIEEMSVPDYGLTSVGEAVHTLGETEARVQVTGTAGTSAATLGWVNAKGRTVKSVPAAVRRDFADELKELKGAIKDLQKMLPAQRDRIDGLFLARRTWAWATFRERYLDHPVVGTIARRLIWIVDDGAAQTAVCWLGHDPDGPPHGDGRLVRVDGSDYEPSPERAIVRLWHPISDDAAPGSTDVREDVQAWRGFFEERRIKQPFKQAHREVYLLTDAERATETYSNRFAAHIIRQHQFNALAVQRGWRNQLRLMVDDTYEPPSRTLEAWGLRAEYWVEGVGDDWDEQWVLDSGSFRYLATDQVRFYGIDAAKNSAHAGGGRYAAHAQDVEGNQPNTATSMTW